MGWERRGGRYYLYRNRRVNGRPVKEYLGCHDPYGFGELLADDLARLLRRQAKLRRLARVLMAGQRARVDQLAAAVAAENTRLRAVTDGVLYALGYHRHRRGEWRMKRDLSELRRQIASMTSSLRQGPTPCIDFAAPDGDAEAVDLFNRARDGDEEVLGWVRQLLQDRGWLEWMGNLARQATAQLIERAAGGDPVWEEALILRTNAIRDDLLGPNWTILEEAIVRRIVNGWLTVHHLELELSTRPAADLRAREHLDRAVSRAQKRMTSAVVELARIRRLQAPALLARLQVVAHNSAEPPQSLPAPDAEQ